MKATTLFILLAFSSIPLLGYDLTSREQVMEDGHRLLSAKHVAELEQILTGLNDADRTDSGWPMKTYLYERLIPLGPPRWEKPVKAKRLCDQYLETFGDTPEYRSLKVQYLILVTYRAVRLGLDGQNELENRDDFIVPHLENASRLLGETPPQERDSLWYLQKGWVLRLKDSDLTEWIVNVREAYPEHPELLIALSYEEGLDVPAIEAEISKRSLTGESADILYAQVITTLLEHHFRNQESFSASVNWDRHMNGLLLLSERHPTDYNYDVYRYFACYLNNKELASILFEEGPERPLTYLWRSSEFPFEDWRAWATGQPTFPKLERDEDLFGVWKVVDAFGSYPSKPENYDAKPTYHAYDSGNGLQIIGMYPGGMNHRTRTWEIISPGHLKYNNLYNGTSSSQTIFTDGSTMIVQSLGAPYGTTYLTYEGTIEEVLPGINATFFELNPNRKSVLTPDNRD